MASNNSSTASGGIGLTGAVFLVFLVLKLTGTDPVASWSWWWVTSPLWIPFGIVAVIFGSIGLIYLVASAFGMVSDGVRSRRKVARLMRDLEK